VTHTHPEAIAGAIAVAVAAALAAPRPDLAGEPLPDWAGIARDGGAH
jgi:ADP-ribosylglycohydrolase